VNENLIAGPYDMKVELDMDDEGKAVLLTLRKIIYEVYEFLGKGYPENVYQKAMGVELQVKSLKYDMEVTMSIPYKEHVIGQVRADIIVRGQVPVVIETKATAGGLKVEERWQLSRYLKILEIPLGVLVNFPQVAKSTEPEVEFLVLMDDQVLLYNIETNEAVPLT
jgi:GxxExxY protein